MKATFEITSWDETSLEEWDGGKITRGSITKKYAGDVEGEAALEYLLAYRPDGTAAFVGIERITGSVDGRDGGLVLEQVGSFADGAATRGVDRHWWLRCARGGERFGRARRRPVRSGHARRVRRPVARPLPDFGVT